MTCIGKMVFVLGLALAASTGAAGQEILTFVSGSNDDTARVWDAAGAHAPRNSTAQQEPRLLKGHGDAVGAVAWSPDGNHLASVSNDETVRIWDAEKGREIRSLKTNRKLSFSFYGSVAWSLDSKRLAASSDSQVRIWDVATGEETLTLKQTAMSLSWSPDGKRLAGVFTVAPGEPMALKVLDAAKGEELLTLKGHRLRVWSVAWSPDGKRLASTSEDGAVKVWDAEKGEEVFAFTHAAGAVYCVCWSADSKRLASTSWNKTVKIWDAERGSELPGTVEQLEVKLTLKGHTHFVVAASWSPDGKRLASAALDGTVKLWDAENGTETVTLKEAFGVGNGKTLFFPSVSWSHDGKRLATAGTFDKGGEIKIWDVGPDSAKGR